MRGFRFRGTMARVIKIHKYGHGPNDNVITLRPFEFRHAHWESAHFIQMLKSQSSRFEQERVQHMDQGKDGVQQLPPHFTLRGSVASTIRGLFLYREDEKKMREVYFLVGIIDCMINQVNPVLRTDLIRDVFKKFFHLKQEFGLNWNPPLDQVLLPIDSHLYNESEYRNSVASAPTLKRLYQEIREGTEEMFQIISTSYVFYCPRGRV